jgi:hypothetical protein
VGFEPTIPVFKRANTIHALDRAATAIGKLPVSGSKCPLLGYAQVNANIHKPTIVDEDSQHRKEGDAVCLKKLSNDCKCVVGQLSGPSQCSEARSFWSRYSGDVPVVTGLQIGVVADVPSDF